MQILLVESCVIISLTFKLEFSNFDLGLFFLLIALIIRRNASDFRLLNVN